MENVETTFYYYTKDVLGYYNLHAHAYKIEMDGVGGCISSRDIDFERAGLIPININKFGLRLLSNNTSSVALWFKDYNDMEECHKSKWDIYRINNPTLSDNDVDFDNWYKRFFKGWWGKYPQPLHDLKRKLKEISQITNEHFKAGLFDYVENTNLIYPLSEHKAQYLNSCLELFKLFDSNINTDCLKTIAKALNKTIIQDKNGHILRINTLKELLSEQVKDEIIKPIHNLRDMRGKRGHEIGVSEPYNAHKEFNKHVLELNAAMAKLLEWLKQTFILSKL